MISLGTTLLAIVSFITYPTWHLVVFYAIILAIIAWSIIKSWGF